MKKVLISISDGAWEIIQKELKEEIELLDNVLSAVVKLQVEKSILSKSENPVSQSNIWDKSRNLLKIIGWIK